MIVMMILAAAAATPAGPAPMAGMEHAAPTCAATPAPPPPELAGWSRMTPLAAGATATGAPLLPPGAGMRAGLLPTPRIRYALAPEKPGDPATSGGLFAFAAPIAGRYRVALGAGAWIDVVRDGKAVASATHGHGPDCSGIRKMVDFDLTAGRYLLQIAGSAMPTLPLMVVRLP